MLQGIKDYDHDKLVGMKRLLLWGGVEGGRDCGLGGWGWWQRYDGGCNL